MQFIKKFLIFISKINENINENIKIGNPILTNNINFKFSYITNASWISFDL